MTLVRACSIADLEPSQALRVELPTASGETIPVAIIRDEDGSWHALGDTCTHANYSLSEGDIDEGAIECWKHGSPFDLRTGQPRTLPATRPVPVFSLTINDGEILVDLDNSL